MSSLTRMQHQVGPMILEKLRFFLGGGFKHCLLSPFFGGTVQLFHQLSAPFIDTNSSQLHIVTPTVDGSEIWLTCLIWLNIPLFAGFYASQKYVNFRLRIEHTRNA